MSDFYTKSEWMNSKQQTMLLDTFFQNSPILINWDLRITQSIVNDNQLVFGPWAGPEQCITHIIHEMAHLAEIDNKRILKHGWGANYSGTIYSRSL